MEYLQLAVKPAGGDQAEPAAAAYPQMRLWNAEWCFPLRVGPDLLGLLAFSCDPVNPSFSAEELRTLAEFCQTLALLTHKLCLTDELELIGRMSRGMAHDLKDLITPLKTLIELVGEDPGAEQRFGQLIPIAARNIEALQAYVDEALFYSRNRAPRITATRLDHALQKVVQLAQPQSRKKRVRVMLSPMAALTIQADEVLVQRMLSNILANAIDASDPNAQVEIEVQSLHKEPDRPPWVRIRVLDWGDGMSEDNLQKLLKGRFTTKGGRWSGLGLSIARQIAQLHGGHISIFSEQSVGTSVEVDLPGCARVPGMAGEGERSALPSEAKSFQKE